KWVHGSDHDVAGRLAERDPLGVFGDHVSVDQPGDDRRACVIRVLANLDLHPMFSRRAGRLKLWGGKYLLERKRVGLSRIDLGFRAAIAIAVEEAPIGAPEPDGAVGTVAHVGIVVGNDIDAGAPFSRHGKPHPVAWTCWPSGINPIDFVAEVVDAKG